MAFFDGYLTRIGDALAGVVPGIQTLLLRKSDGSAIMAAGNANGAALVEIDSATALPLPTGAATAAAQTDGSQKAIVRGAAKGTTVAADATVVPVSANVAGLDVFDNAPTQAPYNYSTIRDGYTAVRAGDDTITITPITLVTGQIVRVRVTTTTTARPLVWEHGRNAVLTVSGATLTVKALDGTAITVPAAATNINVMWAGQDKALDASLQATRTAPLYDMRSFRQTDLVALLGANQTITNAWADVGPEMLADGSTDLRAWIGITKGDGTVTTVQARLLVKHTSGGTDEYPIPVTKVDISAAPYVVSMGVEEPYLTLLDASGIYSMMWRLGNTVKYAQLQIKAATPGTTMVLVATSTGYTMGWGG